jgi:hypothetical protein
VQKYFSLLSSFICLFVVGCDVSNNPQMPKTGDWKIILKIMVYDEFFRVTPAVGPFTVTLASKDRSEHLVIADSEHVFNNMPYQKYIFTVDRIGYLQATGIYNQYQYYKIITVPAELYPIPSVATKIDSIHYLLNSITPQVRFQLYTAQSLPLDGTRNVVLFAGLTPDISSTFGTYVYATDLISQPRGSSEIDTKDFYKELHASGIPSGARVYITARITTGATAASIDAITGLTIYSNLENNTKANASFILP